ncbi:MAG: GNAT family N-acetyltransferase [Bradymonadaceae bacterium]
MDIDRVLEAAVSDFFWAPDDVSVVERSEVTYAYSDRPGANYNNVPRTRPDRADVEALVDEVVDRHEGSWSRWGVKPTCDVPELREALAGAGYEPVHELAAYAVDPREYERDMPDDVQIEEVSDVEDLRRLYEIWDAAFGGAPDLSDEELAEEVETCTGEGRRVARFLVYRDGEPAGTGGLTIFDDLEFGMIWGGAVREEHRGNGCYTALLQARADLAASRELRRIGLYARRETSAPIVDAHGFDRHGPVTHYYLDLRE